MQSNRLPPTALVPALKASMSQADLAKEFGITGTTNFRGDLLTESNAKLVHEQAFGQPGSRTWGEWEKILMTDPAVSTAMEFTTASLRAATVDFQPPDPDLFTDRTLPQKMTDFCRWNLLGNLDPTWPELLRQLANQLVFGFSLHELIAGEAQHKLLPGGGGYRLKKLAERLPVSIHPMGWIESPDTKELAAIRQWGPMPGTGQWTEALLPAEKLLLSSWNRRGNNYLGFSAFRSVWYWCKAREMIAKLVPISMSREGAGVPVAYAADKSSRMDEKSRKRLQKFLANLQVHENASAVMPAGWKLEWFNSGSSANKGHIVDVYNAISTIILQQVMAQHLQLGVAGKSGSRSVGETQDPLSDLFIGGVLENISGTLNGIGERAYTGLAPRLCRWNWGPQPAYPTIKLTITKDKVALEKYAPAIVAMKQGGVITVWTHEDENAARDHAGLDPIEEAEFQAERDKRDEQAEAQAEALKQAAQQTPPAPGHPPTQSTERNGSPPKPGASGSLPSPVAGAPKKLATWAPRRPLRPSEQNVALADINDFLDGAKDRFARGARPLVAELLAKALPDVQEAMKGGSRRLADVPLDMKRLEEFVGQYIAKCRAEGYRQVASEARKAGVSNVKLAGEDDEDEDEALFEALRKQAARRLENRIREQLEAAGVDVERTGGEASEVIGEVLSAQVESSMLAGVSGLITTKAFNLGREEFADEYADSIESVELSSILDDNTCDYCDQHDGDEFDFQSGEHDSMTPPLRDCDGRDRCRCILIYNFKSG